jgi:hypothetical protein
VYADRATYGTGHGSTFQMPAAYSAMVRSVENGSFDLHRLLTALAGAMLESPWPGPLIDLWLIHAMLVSVVLAVDLHVTEGLFGVGAGHLQ